MDVDRIYVERRVADHARTVAILARFPRASVIECDSYQTLFNRHAQNFRAQKARPALILAKKMPPFTYAVPATQHIGGAHNYYFSHLLNCPFDCRYCFLQGMFSSANYVLFVNYEDFIDEIESVSATHIDPVHFFSGYDCDSLALEPLTGFAEHFIPAVATIDNAVLELRTKSVQIRALVEMQANDHCVVAMSLAPAIIAERFEHRTPSLEDRLGAVRRLQDNGWSVGLRIDPLIAIEDASTVYCNFIEYVMSKVDSHRIHSITLGQFRLPRAFAKRMFKLYPEEPLFAGPLREVDGTFVFGQQEQDLIEASRNAIANYISADKIFVQHET